MARIVTYDRIVNALDRSVARTQRRDDTLYREPSIQSARLKRQAYTLSMTLLEWAKEVNNNPQG